ncbi:MAG TPA: DUF2975 domain-containing protein [Ohtaekwangia sp.]
MVQIRTKTRTEQILTVMNILAWVAFIGFSIEAGALMISYGISFVNPEGAKNFYKGLDLFSLRETRFWDYTGVVSFMVAVAILKSTVWMQVIKVTSKINLVNPFTMEIASILEKISYSLFSIWLVGMLSNGYTQWLEKNTGVDYYGKFVQGEFIFMAGLVFIISQIFKRGVEIQSENELTV